MKGAIEKATGGMLCRGFGDAGVPGIANRERPLADGILSMQGLDQACASGDDIVRVTTQVSHHAWPGTVDTMRGAE